MKRFVFFFLFIFIFIHAGATTYYSKVGQANPNALASWDINPGGGGGSPGSFTVAGDIFIIQSGHSMTTTATWTIGGAGSKLQIMNTATLQGNHVIQFTGTFQIDNGGTYIHNNNGTVAQTPVATSIFSGTESFGASSNFEIRNWQSTIQGLPNAAPGIAWGNLIVNLLVNLGGDWNWNISAGTPLTINGNLDIKSTYSSTPARELRFTGSGDQNINVAGNFLLSGTSLVNLKQNAASTATGNVTMQVNGNISLTGTSQLNIGSPSSAAIIGTFDLRFKGNFSAAAGTIITETSSAPYLVANGVSAQTLSCVPILDCNFRVASGSTVNLSSTLTTGTNRTVAVSGTLNQNSNVTTVNGKLENAGGIFNSNAGFTVGINCTSCTGDGTYNSGSNTWCTLSGTKGAINFLNNPVSLNNNIATTFISAGNILINSPGDVYMVNSIANNIGTTFSAAYILRPSSIFSIDENSYVAGGTGTSYLGQGGTLRIGSVNGITASTSTGNVRTQTRTYNASGTNDFEYFGSNPQVTGDGLPTTIAGTLRIDNSSPLFSLGVTLTNSTTINGILDLDLGKLRTSSSSLITITAAGNFASYGTDAFIGGPLQVIGHAGFTFPVGINAAAAPTGTIYAPIVMNNVSGTSNPTDSYTAEYIRNNPQTALSNNVEAPINHTSFIEYWKFLRTDGGTNTPVKQIVLTVNPESMCYNLNTLLVARFNGTIWKNEGNSGTIPVGSSFPLVWGILFSNNTITNVSGYYTLSTTDQVTDNPLPIRLLSFDATKLSNTRSTVNWELGAICSPAARFEIQRAGTYQDFVTIGAVSGSITDKLYSYLDNGLKSGINYYRIKMVDEDGKTSYSRIVAVLNGVDGLLLTSLIPTMITNTATLTIASSSHQQLDLAIIDMYGRTVKKQSINVGNGNTNIELPLSSLAPGVYHIVGISTGGKTNTIRFLKQ